jgi:hypothetical protein
MCGFVVQTMPIEHHAVDSEVQNDCVIVKITIYVVGSATPALTLER